MVKVEIRAADIFDDVRQVIGPKHVGSNVCFCLNYRLGTTKARALREPERSKQVAKLCAQNPAPGVLAYLNEKPVGWAAVHPRAETAYATNRLIPHIDDLPVWSLWCFRTLPGYRGQGIMHDLVAGAVAFARDNGAPAIEGYPVDNAGLPVDRTMAYVGTRRLFERAGFRYAATTSSVLAGFSRVLMRRAL